jgi:hypothetical protein
MTDECQTLQEQTGWMKEAWKNISPAECCCQKCERKQQNQKEKNELHEMMHAHERSSRIHEKYV